jgi:hypothetical protein
MRHVLTAAAGIVLAAALLVSVNAPGRSATRNVVHDPGFESGGTSTWQQCGSDDARVSSVQAHRGTYSLRAGSKSRTSGQIDGDEGLCQSVKVPANGVLTFWVNALTTETSTEFSYQEAEFLDDEGNTVRMLWQASAQTNGWAQKTVDVSAFAGQTLRLYFGVHGNGYAKTYTILYVDDVSLTGGGTPGGTPTSGPMTTPGPLTTPVPFATAVPTPSGGTTSPSFATPTAGGATIPPPSTAAGATCGTHCGTERWHVKTMSDPQAARVDRTIRTTTVDELIHASVPVPPSGSLAKADNIRFAPWELRAVQIRATVVGWKTENDNDYHIVVADMRNAKETMIVEPPSSSCSSACSSGYGAFFQGARDAFVHCMGTPSTQFTYINTKTVVADITGVPYFDPIHGQTGVAPNGIEIHPVINVSFVSGC